MKPPLKKFPWQRWNGGFGPDLMPIIPAQATLKAGSSVREVHKGKVPGTRNADGTWSGLSGKYEDHVTDEPAAKLYYAMGAGIGLQGRNYPGLDIDVEDGALADEIQSLAENYMGLAPVRSRPGSSRRLLMYRG